MIPPPAYNEPTLHDCKNILHNRKELFFRTAAIHLPGAPESKEAFFPLYASTPLPTPTPAVTALALPDKPSIAVLPLKNLPYAPEQEHISDGITEDIITELSRFDEYVFRALAKWHKVTNVWTGPEVFDLSLIAGRITCCNHLSSVIRGLVITFIHEGLP